MQCRDKRLLKILPSSSSVFALFTLTDSPVRAQNDFSLSCKGLIVLKFCKINTVIFTEAGTSSLLCVELLQAVGIQAVVTVVVSQNNIK